MSIPSTCSGIWPGFATDMSTDWDPVPDYRETLGDYEAFKARIRSKLEEELAQPDFLEQYAAANETTVAELLVSQAQRPRARWATG